MSRPLESSPVMPTTIDSMDSLIDFSEYDNASSFQSPTLSNDSRKQSLARPTTAAVTPSLLPTSQPLSGPSHQYDQYKQQTGFVPGALADTWALNQSVNVAGYTGFGSLDGLDYLGINGANEFDFATAPSQTMTSPDLEMDFDSPTDEPSAFLFGEPTINPTAISQSQDSAISPIIPSTTSNVGRMRPGMHTQAAKVQAQQLQQRQILEQQNMARQNALPQKRAKGVQPTDPIIEQKISQLLNSMRAKPASPESQGSGSVSNVPRIRKPEEDMDDDERLLASEEGKKLTSKERRQLRNKVSARAFRSRRKEYITQLEAEIATNAADNQELKITNRALMEENKRLSDLTRMLLSSPSFSDFLDRLSSNPQPAPVQQAPAAEPRQERQAPKDPNPYAASQNIGLAMIPERNMDFSMLSMGEADPFSFRPQVYAVPEIEMDSPIDASILSGKESNFVGRLEQEEKVEMPVIEHPAEEKKEVVEVEQPTAVVDEEFENDDLFALYHDDAPVSQPAAPLELNTEAMSNIDLFGGVEPEKAFARYELVGATEEEVNEAEDAAILARVARIVGNMEAISARLDSLCLMS